jgi:hypothetical protein
MHNNCENKGLAINACDRVESADFVIIKLMPCTHNI